MRMTSSITWVHRQLLVACVSVATLLPMCTAQAQGAQPPALRAPAQQVAPVDPGTLSCADLKSRLEGAGEMSILSGPRGAWGDTFYGPGVPRCPFWQMPQFAYVSARDGLCGVGYICVDKYTID